MLVSNLPDSQVFFCRFEGAVKMKLVGGPGVEPGRPKTQGLSLLTRPNSSIPPKFIKKYLEKIVGATPLGGSGLGMVVLTTLISHIKCRTRFRLKLCYNRNRISVCGGEEITLIYETNNFRNWSGGRESNPHSTIGH